MFRTEIVPDKLWEHWIEAAQRGDIYVGDLTSREQTLLAAMMIDRIANDRNRSEIRLWINSHGGYLTNASHLRDVIMRARHKGKHIRAHNCGIVASAAVEVYLAADERTMAADAYFYIHSVRAWAGYATPEEYKRGTEFLDEVTGRLAHWYAERTKKSAKFWRRLLEDATGKHIFEPEATEWGILT